MASRSYSTRSDFLQFSPPSVGEDEIAAVAEVLRSGWISKGPKTRQFEERFAATIGAPDALAFNSCTAALHTALVALGVGPGDEVITTTLTFCATVNVIEHVGATPVLVDVEPDTGNIDPSAVSAALTLKTRVILPVHLAGHPADLDALHAIADSNTILILEDAAHAVGAVYKGRPIGSGGSPVAFSFYATKNLTTADGGALTATKAIIDRARPISLHGITRTEKAREECGAWCYDVMLPGYSYNMTDVQAAIGLVQLERLACFQRRRREIVEQYTAAFRDCEALELPASRPEVDHAWHLYVIRLRHEALSIDRNGFIHALRERNIGTSVHYGPVHLHSYYRNKYNLVPTQFPIALDYSQRAISLPLHAGLSDQDASDVCEAVLDVVKAYRR